MSDFEASVEFMDTFHYLAAQVATHLGRQRDLLSIGQVIEQAPASGLKEDQIGKDIVLLADYEEFRVLL